ncbi:type II toxin-antitoxin system prevent-host-death family antitoxin [Aerophototrophica crusticola]|uniref:Antitoxin n=1 Tax=Aerophototrophica crusticola TaxID=1709002 RepID=A0A858RC89_9PROT|nr:type II toxin-antitoxin system prevent-host-death family antitoxin [Rhodospirillaceae bacterium B3]
MRTVNLSQADSHLASLVDEALAGEDVVITRGGRPVVRLVPVGATDEQPRKRQFGQWAGRIKVHDNFDDPLPEEMMRTFRGEDA